MQIFKKLLFLLTPPDLKHSNLLLKITIIILSDIIRVDFNHDRVFKYIFRKIIVR